MDINNEMKNWLSEGETATDADYWKVGEPTFCDLVDLNKHACKRIGSILRSSTGLKAFCLAGIAIRDEISWEILMMGLKNNSSIHTLELNQISTPNLILRLPAPVQKLTLIDCALPDSFRMSDLPGSVKELRIIGCNLRSVHLRSARQWVSQHSSLELLDLRGNQLDSDICVSLASFLARATSLQKLVLEDTNLSDDLLMTLFAQHDVHFHSLNVGENQLKDASVVFSLATKHLFSTIKLHGNPLSFRDCGSELEKNTSLRRLDLSSCSTGDCHFAFLSSIPHLKLLNVSANNLDERTINIIGGRNVESLDLHNCQLTDALCSALFLQLSPGCCSSINLENNRITTAAPIAAWMTRGANQQLTSLRLAGNPLALDDTVWGDVLEHHCWGLVNTSGLGALHWIRLNRAGRSFLTTGDVYDAERLVEILENAHRVDGMNALFYMLRQSPHLIIRTIK